jgi:hypothetical protein
VGWGTEEDGLGQKKGERKEKWWDPCLEEEMEGGRGNLEGYAKWRSV